ncbi:hypothetical protein SHKM778_72620 [Streptomyces sp. KM77-8]|uniref:Amine oxidase domain-containing protein n=1 Tax=Streptomyces haneummycinicus TaxID=3074435 RepID=A0AAT9HUQ8_9ACTN
MPEGGAQALPRQLAQGLPAGTVRTGVRVTSVSTTSVTTAEHGEFRCGAVLIATGAREAAELLPGLRVPDFHPVTVVHHTTDEAPGTGASLLLDAERGGPVAHTAVVSRVDPSRAPAGRTLVSSTVLGPPVPGVDTAVRIHLARLYGVPTARWETVGVYHSPEAVPAMRPPHDLRRPVRLLAGLYVCGDHRDTGTVQGRCTRLIGRRGRYWRTWGRIGRCTGRNRHRPRERLELTVGSSVCACLRPGACGALRAGRGPGCVLRSRRLRGAPRGAWAGGVFAPRRLRGAPRLEWGGGVRAARRLRGAVAPTRAAPAARLPATEGRGAGVCGARSAAAPGTDVCGARGAAAPGTDVCGARGAAAPGTDVCGARLPAGAEVCGARLPAGAEGGGGVPGRGAVGAHLRSVLAVG